MNKKTLLVIICLGMFIIPTMSFNIEQSSQATTEQSETEIITNGTYTIYEGCSVSYNLGYMRGDYHDVVDWEFTSTTQTIRVMLMTADDYDDYIYWLLTGIGYWNYWLLSDGKLADSGIYDIHYDNSYYLVFRNPNSFSTDVTINVYKDSIKAFVGIDNYVELDSDNDGYNDSLQIEYTIFLNYILPDNVAVDYYFEIRQDSYVIDFVDSFTLLKFYKTIIYNFEGSGIYQITCKVYYDDEFYADDYFYKTTSELYPVGYAQQLEDEAHAELMSKIKLGLAIGIPSLVVIVAIITTVVLIQKKKNII